MLRPVAAFVTVAAETYTWDKPEGWIEQTKKVQRQTVFCHPSVCCADTAETERFQFRLMAKPNAIFAVQSEAELQAGIWIDLKVEITAICAEGKEKLHAAVLVDGAEWCTIFCANVCFPCPLADIKCRFIVTKLLCHANAAVRLPEDRIDRQNRDSVPIRNAVHFQNHIFLHKTFPPRQTMLRFRFLSQTTKSARFPAAMEPISFSQPSSLAGISVAERTACSFGMPNSTAFRIQS